ncbi:oxidoreductase [Halioxenophilus sp. WMMB6]|uniref:oxidoreductase n=1 Tax=Halioxenophilus sp. WMMB6 TaxID=3073815 RepID=UPI00295F4C59|nr:oxidoreductase [Halioxenophilus sp. WMMB6]
MSVKTVVITGANSGIGYQATQHFAQLGWRVVMACRSLDKAEKALAEIKTAVPEGNITILKLDVSDLESVCSFVEAFKAEIGQLDILINNAGIVAIPLTRNAAGHEQQVATNYLGAFALTGQLLPLFNSDGECRIVNVCSLAHRFGKLVVENLNWEESEYNEWKGYANSKVAMMSHTLELNRRLQAAGSNIIAVGAHPGFANTNIHQNSPSLSKERKGLSKWFHSKMERLIPTAADAARPIILAAEGVDVAGGDYYGPGGFLEIGGKPAKARINKVAKDSELAKQLWQKSEAMTDVSFLSEAK